ncbi:MAG TPA: DUF58 domain-containing protein, partial [Diaminobutyricibacter sp.]
MTVSGRFVALIALGAIPLVLFGADGGTALLILAGWLAFAVVVGVLDLALAASPRRVAIERRVPGRVRMGADALSELYLTNTGG